MPKAAGLYLHIPFCEKKCAYCDFYSAFSSDEGIDTYLRALLREIKRWGGSFGRPIDTVYIGGGTPSLLGERILELMSAVRESFDIASDAEITAELNPSGEPEGFLASALRAGVNRLSIGVQTSSDERLSFLGRRHTALSARHTVDFARSIGFKNISLDLMLALPNETLRDVREDAEFFLDLKPEHISAYMLKIEPGTRLYRDSTRVPDSDLAADMYLAVCEALKNAGYRHYEISSFALEGFESAHNLKYWRGEEYLGIGPAAHSFAGGKRFYYPRDLKGFISSPHTVADGLGGDTAELTALALRISDGLDISPYPSLMPFAEKLSKAGLANIYGNRLSLTDRGMLVSNEIITEILEIIL